MAGVAALCSGARAGIRLRVEGAGEIALAELKKAHEGWFPAYMGERASAGELKVPPWRCAPAKSKN